MAIYRTRRRRRREVVRWMGGLVLAVLGAILALAFSAATAAGIVYLLSLAVQHP